MLCTLFFALNITIPSIPIQFGCFLGLLPRLLEYFGIISNSSILHRTITNQNWMFVFLQIINKQNYFVDERSRHCFHTTNTRSSSSSSHILDFYCWWFLWPLKLNVQIFSANLSKGMRIYMAMVLLKLQVFCKICGDLLYTTWQTLCYLQHGPMTMAIQQPYTTIHHIIYHPEEALSTILLFDYI